MSVCSPVGALGRAKRAGRHRQRRQPRVVGVDPQLGLARPAPPGPTATRPVRRLAPASATASSRPLGSCIERLTSNSSTKTLVRGVADVVIHVGRSRASSTRPITRQPQAEQRQLPGPAERAELRAHEQQQHQPGGDGQDGSVAVEDRFSAELGHAA